jgi:hypothetical protein
MRTGPIYVRRRMEQSQLPKKEAEKGVRNQWH